MCVVLRTSLGVVLRGVVLAASLGVVLRETLGMV